MKLSNIILVIYICLYALAFITLPAYALFKSSFTDTHNTFTAAEHFNTITLVPDPTISVIPSISPTIAVSPSSSISIVPSVSPVPTSTLPEFGICPAVNGTVQASYATGMHAIVGMDENQPGSDEVFSIGNGNYTQCYCPIAGTAGIQTNWLAAGSITSDDKSSLLASGWTLIQKGSDWGLLSQPYLAKNQPFVCSLLQ